MQQVTSVRKTKRDPDSTFSGYSEQIDMYYKSAGKKVQMKNDEAVSSFNYTSGGLENEAQEMVPHFDKQA